MDATWEPGDIALCIETSESYIALGYRVTAGTHYRVLDVTTCRCPEKHVALEVHAGRGFWVCDIFVKIKPKDDEVLRMIRECKPAKILEDA